ncbi:MAG: cation diffusion facilitator family transporter [Methanothrix sp.]
MEMMEKKSAEKEKQKSSVALLSVASNTILIVLKLLVGSGIGSVSIISEAVHSSVDLLAAIIAFLAVKASGKPADESHPFGHGKLENISGTVEALLIFLAAGWILIEAADKLRDPRPLDNVAWGALVMLISAGANIFVSRRLFKVAEETGSVALKADACHLQADIYTSLGVLAGLAVILVGGWIMPEADLLWVDPVAAIVVALMIIKAAYHLTVESARDLIDVRLPADEVEEVRRHIISFAPTIRGFHKLRTRKAGADRFVDFHIRVDAAMSVDESHRITDVIASTIKEHYPGTTVSIHIEPCNCALSQDVSCGCLLSEEARRRLQSSGEAAGR